MATDPRLLKGAIAGPGGPHDRHGVDITRAVLVDGIEVCAVEASSAGVSRNDVIALQLTGRVNQTRDRAELLFLFDVAGVASLITELIALASRMDADGLQDLIVARIDRLADEDALGGHRG